ncbi:MAG TPA: ABC transporter permease [Mycobacteriales bacterium]|nr:ABC transporter permease [Mycobacteriales bacterium]
MTGLRLVLHQLRYDQKTFWRDPAAVGFTVALPLIFLFVFVTIFGNESTTVNGHKISGATYYVPGIVTIGLVSASFLNLAISMTVLRERGALKRVRSTPLPAWVFMAGRMGTAVVVSLFLTTLLVALGRLVYGVEVPGSTMVGALLAVLVGTLALCTLGLALTAVIPSQDAAPPITNVIVLPLYFFSGLFVPTAEIPEWMQTIANIFPIKPLFEAVLLAFDPATTGLGIAGKELIVVAAWGMAGLLIALRFFRWTPR